MRLLVVVFVAACVLGAQSQLSPETLRNADRLTKKLDNICKKSLGAIIDRVFGPGEQDTVCGLNGRVNTFIDPNSGCANSIGSTSNITITLGISTDCEFPAGCAGSTRGVLSGILKLVPCLLRGNILNPLLTAVQNILKGLQGDKGQGQLKDILLLLRFTLDIVARRLTQALCNPTFTTLSIALVLPVVVSILLFGVIFGLVQSPLAPVGFLLLGLLPVVLLLVFIVSGLVVLLSPLLDRAILPGLKQLLVSLVGGLLGRGSCKAVMNSGSMESLSFSEITKLFRPPSIMDIMDLFNSFKPGALGGDSNALGNLGGLSRLGGLGNLGGMGNFGGMGSFGNMGGFGGMGGFNFGG